MTWGKLDEATGEERGNKKEGRKGERWTREKEREYEEEMEMEMETDGSV